jgi:hypothetical protein
MHEDIYGRMVIDPNWLDWKIERSGEVDRNKDEHYQSYVSTEQRHEYNSMRELQQHRSS